MPPANVIQLRKKAGLDGGTVVIKFNVRLQALRHNLTLSGLAAHSFGVTPILGRGCTSTFEHCYRSADATSAQFVATGYVPGAGVRAPNNLPMNLPACSPAFRRQRLLVAA